MTDPEQNDDSTLASEDEAPEPLRAWERACALTVGAICGGAGGYAVYEKTNQAGTVMLLVLAAIFLLIGVQGTPLIKFGSNSGSLELERRRRKRVQEALEQASAEGSVEKAEGIVEGVNIVAPDLVPNSFRSYMHYENNVATALISLGYDVTREPNIRGLRLDLGITKNNRTVYAELKYYSRPVPSAIVHKVIGIAAVTGQPALLIANTQLTVSAQAFIDGTAIDFVQWRDERDNPKLRSTLERMLAQASHNGGRTLERNEGD